jgi:hypothetical protein
MDCMVLRKDHWLNQLVEEEIRSKAVEYLNTKAERSELT